MNTNKTIINVGVIGFGYWGPNLVRNFYEQSQSDVVAVCDSKPDKLLLAQKRYPTIKTCSNYEEICDDPEIDAVIIATPVSTHYEFAMNALQKGKHVFITKPIADSSKNASILINEAKKRGLILMVDHTFVYTSAVRKIRELIASNELGDIFYFDSVRVNLGLFQHDVNVIWDLAVHDLSIMDYVLQLRPRAVSATGISHINNEPENIAYLTLFFDNKLIAHIHVNWLAPVKVRRTLISGNKKMIVYDDLEPSDKLKIYDKGITVNNSIENVYKMLISYRTGDMWAPKLELCEALSVETSHFIDCIKNGEKPVTDGASSLRVVKIIEAATQSMKNRGQPVELNDID